MSPRTAVDSPPRAAGGWDREALAGLVTALGTVTGDAVEDRELLARLNELERVKAAAAAAQVRLTAAFAASQARAEAAAREAARGRGFEAWQQARDAYRGKRSVSAQIGFARRLSPWQAAHQLTVAAALTTTLPHTLAALSAGVISERRAGIVVTETGWLSEGDQSAVDAEVCGDSARLRQAGDRELTQRARAVAYALDPQGALDRARAAAAERRVSLRPRPDSMCRLSALLPVAQGVAAYAALSRAADSARAAEDPRTRGQVLADTLVERVTGQANAAAVPVEVQLVLSDAALLGSGKDADAPAQIAGYGAVPAGWARDLLRGLPLPAGARGEVVDSAMAGEATVWLRRLYARPGRLIAMESRRRVFPPGLRRFLLARDGFCRTPWCDAPIRHYDHVGSREAGGATSAANGQGLCEACNYVKALPGWRVTTVDAGRRTRWHTPLGLTYDCHAQPALPGTTRSTAPPEPTSDSPIELSLWQFAA